MADTTTLQTNNRERGTIIVNSSALMRMLTPLSEEYAKNKELWQRTGLRLSDMLLRLADEGYHIIIPPAVALECGDVLPNGISVREFFPKDGMREQSIYDLSKDFFHELQRRPNMEIGNFPMRTAEGEDLIFYVNRVLAILGPDRPINDPTLPIESKEELTRIKEELCEKLLPGDARLTLQQRSSFANWILYERLLIRAANLHDPDPRTRHTAIQRTQRMFPVEVRRDIGELSAYYLATRTSLPNGPVFYLTNDVAARDLMTSIPNPPVNIVSDFGMLKATAKAGVLLNLLPNISHAFAEAWRMVKGQNDPIVAQTAEYLGRTLNASVVRSNQDTRYSNTIMWDYAPHSANARPFEDAMLQGVSVTPYAPEELAQMETADMERKFEAKAKEIQRAVHSLINNPKANRVPRLKEDIKNLVASLFPEAGEYTIEQMGPLLREHLIEIVLEEPRDLMASRGSAKVPGNIRTTDENLKKAFENLAKGCEEGKPAAELLSAFNTAIDTINFELLGSAMPKRSSGRG